MDRADHSQVVDDMIAGVLALYKQGKIRPEVGAVFTIEQFHEALDSVLARTIDGKCILTFSENDY